MVCNAIGIKALSYFIKARAYDKKHSIFHLIIWIVYSLPKASYLVFEDHLLASQTELNSHIYATDSQKFHYPAKNKSLNLWQFLPHMCDSVYSNHIIKASSIFRPYRTLYIVINCPTSILSLQDRKPRKLKSIWINLIHNLFSFNG